MTRKIATYVTAAVLGAALLAATQALSQEGEKPAMPSMDQMMKMYEKLNAPGPEHARFQEAIGTWKTEAKSWMGPGEPTVSSGTSQIEVIFGGRYFQEHYRCDSPDMPFEGLNLIGYDNHKKKYVSVWVDNLSTGFVIMEGTRDDATKTTTLTGEYDDPFFGPSKLRSTIRELSKDQQAYEMYRTGPDGREQKVMEITYTRQPS
jgi:hypothetical protein